MGVKYSDTIERMRWAGKLKNDSAVARTLAVTPQALSNYKKRGALPTDLVIRFSNIYALSVDWLLTGEGDVHKIGYQPAEGEGFSPQHLSGAFHIADMNSDEIIYIGKLLKILRGADKNNSTALKWSVDAFCKAEFLQEEKTKTENESSVEPCYSADKIDGTRT